MDYDTLTEEDMAWMNYYFGLDWMTHCILLDATFYARYLLQIESVFEWNRSSTFC